MGKSWEGNPIVTKDSDKQILQLSEYIPLLFPLEAISYDLGEILWRKYSSQISVEFPSPKTDGQWQLISQGWVGYIPCAPELGIALQPKVELGNLFRMLEYAYRLKSFQFLEGLFESKSLAEFYERLANVLGRRVLDRGRRGFYRAYLPETKVLPFIRGRVNVRQTIQKPYDVKLQCHYEEHTADIEENQILSWTLWRIAHSAICTERVLPTVRRAYHSIRGLASVRLCLPRNCIGRLYNRLNDDYKPMHALCRFFLEHSGPSHEMGDRTMLPFLVNMERLYELFVSEWLKAHLPSSLMLSVQEKVDVGEDQSITFKIDLVLYDVETGKALCVLDTKYKAKDKPETDDIAKVVTYAEMKGCHEAILVYPVNISVPFDESFGKIRVKSMTFSLSGDLEEAGQAFIECLLDRSKHKLPY